MGDVLDIGPVEEVRVVADLVLAPAAEVDLDDVVLRLDIALADDAGRADGGGEEGGALGAVGLDDDLFGCGLDVGVSRSARHEQDE